MKLITGLCERPDIRHPIIAQTRYPIRKAVGFNAAIASVKYLQMIKLAAMPYNSRPHNVALYPRLVIIIPSSDRNLRSFLSLLRLIIFFSAGYPIRRRNNILCFVVGWEGMRGFVFLLLPPFN